ncbi:MAG: LVIVD repeat-containing protein [Balneolaceae bacterium]
MKNQNTYHIQRRTLIERLLAGLVIFLFVPLLLASCEDSSVQTITWIEFEPVYMSMAEFQRAVDLEESRDLVNPGKIYFYNGFLFINEVNKGVHIIDNRNPSAPVNTGFINIPANKDIAIKDDILYADSQKDLLVFDITNMQQAELIDRIEDVFNVTANRPPGFTTQTVDPSRGIVVDWKAVERTEVCEEDCRFHPANRFNVLSTGARTESFFAADGGGSGTGGSMARFAITGDHLYAVDHSNLITFNISSSSPSKTNNLHVGWAIETIFPYQQNLFIGSETAMYIFNINNPSMPQQLSIYRHSTACDPVVVEGDFAFVTLREGTRCPNGINRLEVVDVSDLLQPKRVNFQEMIKPHGLGIDNGKLFVSEGEFGLKIMDATDPLNIKLIDHIKDIRTFDVIPFNGVLMVTGESGINQYDYSDIYNLKHLSTIPVVSE